MAGSIIELFRDPNGAQVPLGRVQKNLTAEFGVRDTSLPAWLTPTLSGASTALTVNQMAASEGSLAVALDATSGSQAALVGPDIDLTKFEEVTLRLVGLKAAAGAHPQSIRFGFYVPTAGASKGVRFYQDQAGTTWTEYALNTGSMGGAESSATGTTPGSRFRLFSDNYPTSADIGIKILPRLKQVYVLEGDNVAFDRDLSAATNLAGVVQPRIVFATTAAGARACTLSKIDIELRHN
jgi:hypothetical protein